MVITAITQQVKNPERANIFVDGGYSFSLSLNELVQERLKKGIEIDEPRLEELKKLSDEGKVRAKALNWVMLRPHSIREFKDYMYRKKVDVDFAAKLIQDFQARNYLSDEQFARWWYEQRSAGNRSNRRIENELRTKGVSREVISATIAATVQITDFNTTTECDRLRAVVAKKQRIARYRSDPTKLMQYLIRQGFSYQDVKRELGRSEDDDTLDD